MHASGEVILPVLQIIGKYQSEGKILLLPLNGKGDINITLGKKRTKCTVQLYPATILSRIQFKYI
jgi:hypothetical protein